MTISWILIPNRTPAVIGVVILTKEVVFPASWHPEGDDSGMQGRRASRPEVEIIPSGRERGQEPSIAEEIRALLKRRGR